jgi:hypothetical protein
MTGGDRFTRRLLYAALLIALPLMACSRPGTSEAVPSASGRYALSSYNGAAIPADIGVLPPNGSNSGGCRLVVSGGSLLLDVAASHFEYAYDVRNQCDGSLLSQPSSQGTVAQQGSALTFAVARVDGLIEFSGWVESGVVTLHPGGTDVLVFR